MNVKIQNEMTSLELVEQINMFRQKEGTKSKLGHNDLLKVIRDEFDEELRLGKISQSSKMVDMPRGGKRKQPMFILTLSQAKQVLVRESKFVRRAVIQYIEKLEKVIQEERLPFLNEVAIEEIFGDQYLDTILANLKRCYEIESFIEKLYCEELMPLYSQNQKMMKAKESMMTGHFCMKYGKAAIK